MGELAFLKRWAQDPTMGWVMLSERASKAHVKRSSLTLVWCTMDDLRRRHGDLEAERMAAASYDQSFHPQVPGLPIFKVLGEITECRQEAQVVAHTVNCEAAFGGDAAAEAEVGPEAVEQLRSIGQQVTPVFRHELSGCPDPRSWKIQPAPRKAPKRRSAPAAAAAEGPPAARPHDVARLLMRIGRVTSSCQASAMEISGANDSLGVGLRESILADQKLLKELFRQVSAAHENSVIGAGAPEDPTLTARVLEQCSAAEHKIRLAAMHKRARHA